MEGKGDKNNTHRELLLPSGESALLLTDCGIEELVRRSEPQARGFLDQKVALDRRVLPLQVLHNNNRRILRVAVGEEVTYEQTKWLAFATGLPVELVSVDSTIIAEAVSRAYLGDEARFSENAGGLMRYGETLLQSVDEREELTGDSQVVQFLNCLLDYAISHQATDIHLSARSGGSFVQLRIGGELREHSRALSNLATHRQLVSRLKVLAHLDIAGHFLPQEGRMQHRYGGHLVDIRISIMPTVHGENVVLRIFSRKYITPINELGIPSDILEVVYRCMRRCSGGLMIAGPTGSGKTSTLYAIVDRLRTAHVVATIEDPVEIAIEGAAQTSINEAAGFGFGEALRAVLRQDPDVVLIGEMREKRTAEAVFDAALSGHLVLSTLHGGSVIEALLRMEHLGVSRRVMAQGLDLLLVQRLTRKLCAECCVFDLRAANAIGCDVYKPVGCAQCNYAGYAGLALIVEALECTEPVCEYLRRTEIISPAGLAEVASGSYWKLQEQLLLCLERGEISYAQYEEFARN